MFDGFVPEGDEPTTLSPQAAARYLINVGSVGQPRDGDPRAGYGIYDAGGLTITMCRVAYPVDGAQRRIIAAGLPASLANRLAAEVAASASLVFLARSSRFFNSMANASAAARIPGSSR